MMKLILLIVYLASLNFSCKNSTNPHREGVVMSITKLYDIKKGKFIDLPNYHPPHKFLYKDSLIIAVVPLIIRHEFDGQVVKDSIGVHHYTFMDLRNRKCAEYLTLTDTATAIKNYTLPDSISLTGGLTLFIDKEIPHIKPVEALADTVIESITYRRMKIINNESAIAPIWICYFRCDKVGSTISYFGGLKEKDGCPMTKYDVLVDENTGYLSQELDFTSSSLTENELKIFSTWEKNINKARTKSN